MGVRTDGRYYASMDMVWKSPTQIENKEGTRKITMGFQVCTVCNHFDDSYEVARWIAEALNQKEFGEPHVQKSDPTDQHRG